MSGRNVGRAASGSKGRLRSRNNKAREGERGQRTELLAVQKELESSKARLKEASRKNKELDKELGHAKESMGVR